MGKANQGIRNELREKDIPHWQLAQTLGVHETTLVRWLRSPLSPENTACIRIAINEIMELREGGSSIAL